MKAAHVYNYGLRDTICIEDIAIPSIQENQLLIQVHYSSINYADHATLTGSPFPIRFSSGLFKPAKPTFGMDIAGVVTAVGSDIKDFQVGDKVFSDVSDLGQGAYSQYLAIEASEVAKLPDNADLKMAGALPLAGITALQGLRNVGRLEAGQKLLINGATGGVGSLAVLIGKAMGAHVTAVASKSKVERMATLKPEALINSSEIDVCQSSEKYDVIFDCATYRPASDYRPVLKEDGIFISNGGAMKHLFKVMIFGKLMSKKNGPTFTNFLARSNRDDLETLAAMYEKGQLNPLIDTVYPLDNLEDAFLHYVSRQVCGKVVIDLIN